MLYPIIDIGSNTVKIAVLDDTNIYANAPVFFKAVPLALRSDVKNNRLSELAIEKLCALIGEYAAIAKRLTVERPIAFATASLRGLDNQDEVLERISDATGISVELISGKTEAYYSFLGARGKFRSKNGCVIDLGGGSTEILVFKGDAVQSSVSLPFGCLTLYNTYFKDGRDEAHACRKYIMNCLKKYAPPFSGKDILLTGGSAKALLRYKNLLENKKNSTLSDKQFDEIALHFRNGDEKERNCLREILKDRFTLVPAALAVFASILAHYDRKSAIVCKNGVREGCLCHYLAQSRGNEKK